LVSCLSIESTCDKDAQCSIQAEKHPSKAISIKVVTAGLKKGCEFSGFKLKKENPPTLMSIRG
jgi:hypothetical protein